MEGHFRCYVTAARICSNAISGLVWKLHPGRYFCLIPPFGIFGPFFRQVQAIGDWKTGTPRRHRQASLLASTVILVYLLVHSIAAPPPPNAYPSLESRCHPRSRQRLVRVSPTRAIHNYALAPAAHHRSRAPWPPNGVRRLARIGWTRCPGPDAPPSGSILLRSPGSSQSSAVVLQRRLPIFVPCGSRQAIHICREALLLWAWRGKA